MPLKINVKSGEKFVVNGVVMVTKVRLCVAEQATILLGKDDARARGYYTLAAYLFFYL